MDGATLVQAVRAHRGEVACLDTYGARLASGGGDRALRLWRWVGGGGGGWRSEAEAQAAHRYGVTAVRWSGGGALLASGGLDGAARVWCGRSLGARRALAAPGAAAVRALCWAGGGGARLVVGHDDGVVLVWAVWRGAVVARVAEHEGALHAVATLARDALLLTACTHGVLKVFDLAAVCNAGTEGGGGAAPAPLLWVDGAHDMGALCADANEDGTAATGGHDARILLWRAGPGTAPLTAAGALEGHAAAVTALRWARGPAGGAAVLASASLDRTARLWAPHAGSCLLLVQAHPRYLTCVAVAPDLRYMITGSNDKSFRTWSLGAFTLDDELEHPCVALEHFGLGDLQGIGPVEEDDESSSGGAAGAVGGSAGEDGDGGLRRVWSAQAHTGAINSIAASGDRLATASSDGSVKVWRWEAGEEGEEGEGGTLVLEHTLLEHRYPALAVDFGAGGAALLTAGLDGCAFVWDVQSGVMLRSLAVPGGGGAAGGEAGGGGVRGARVSPHRAPLLLLATDDGLAPLWGLTDPDPHPAHVYTGHTEAVTCCAWSADGRVAATGAASGELRLLAPPEPAVAPSCLHHDSQAHDLGVLSCDFASPSADIELPEGSHLLATGGCDSLVKLWRVDLREDPAGGSGIGGVVVRLLRSVAAHGGAVASVRWSGAAELVTAGADAWARVWRVALHERGGGVRVVEAGAAPVRGAGGALAAAPAGGGALLAVGSLGGELALWRLAAGAARAPDDDGGDDDDDDHGAAPRLWGPDGVARWLRDYVLRFSDGSAAAALLERARGALLTGARLLADSIEDLLRTLGLDEDTDDPVTAQNARAELEWLRAAPPPRHSEHAAPHSLLCPLSHRLLAWPARAADGFSYESANLLEWLRAAPPEGAVSPVSGRRLRSTRVSPNYALQDALRAFLRDTVTAATDADVDAAADVNTDAAADADADADAAEPDDTSTPE